MDLDIEVDDKPHTKGQISLSPGKSSPSSDLQVLHEFSEQGIFQCMLTVQKQNCLSSQNSSCKRLVTRMMKTIWCAG